LVRLDRLWRLRAGASGGGALNISIIVDHLRLPDQRRENPLDLKLFDKAYFLGRRGMLRGVCTHG
jgi:hypothetical protein